MARRLTKGSKLSTSQIVDAQLRGDTRQIVEACRLEREESESLNRLWEIIGADAYRLDLSGKSDFILALGFFVRLGSKSTALWEAMELTWLERDNFDPYFIDTIPQITKRNAQTVLDIRFSRLEAMQAIMVITAAQLRKETQLQKLVREEEKRERRT